MAFLSLPHLTAGNEVRVTETGYNTATASAANVGNVFKLRFHLETK